MRKVSLDISKLGLIVNDVIKLQLINTVGGLLISTSGYFLDKDITLASATFEYDLLQSEDINQISTYKLTLPNALEFTFNLPSDDENQTHDLLSLLRIGCYTGIVKDGELDSKFIEKLNLYFTGENPHFSTTEKDLVNLYEYYADEIIDTTSTIDIVRKMDKYLATIGAV
jgi:hypothetical protein